MRDWLLVVLVLSASAGCGAATDVVEANGSELDGAHSLDLRRSHAEPPEFHFSSGDYTPRPADLPPAAADWDWPPLSAFESRFGRQTDEASAPGVVIGRFIPAAFEEEDENVPAGAPDVWAARPSVEGGMVLENHNPLRICRGGDLRRERWAVYAGNTDARGVVELTASPSRRWLFRIDGTIPTRRLSYEDWSDLVYARTLVESGLELAETNANTASDEAWNACTGGDDAVESCEVDSRFELERAAELGRACYESGLVGCYWASRLRLIDDWASRWDQDALPPGIPGGVLSRGPIELVRFFIGLLIDAEVVQEPVFRRSCMSVDSPIWLALAAVDANVAADVVRELERRALDPKSDLWTRIWMVALLTAVHDLEASLDGGPMPGAGQRRDVAFAHPACAAAMIVRGESHVEEAHSHCVQAVHEIWRLHSEARTFDEFTNSEATLRELFAGWARAAASLSPPLQNDTR